MTNWQRIPVPCCSCGDCAIRVEFKQWHSFSRIHVTGLLKLVEAVRRVGAPTDRSEMHLRNGEYTNFAQMAWWGLIESFTGNRWDLSEKGWRFLHGRGGIPRRVLTFRNRVIGESIGLHFIHEFVDAETWEKAQHLANRIIPSGRDYRQLALTV